MPGGGLEPKDIQNAASVFSTTKRQLFLLLFIAFLLAVLQPLANYIPVAERYSQAEAGEKKNQDIYRDVIEYYRDGTYKRIDDMHIQYKGKVYDNFWKMVKDAKTPEERKELLMHPPYVKTNMKFFVMPKEMKGKPEIRKTIGLVENPKTEEEIIEADYYPNVFGVVFIKEKYEDFENRVNPTRLMICVREPPAMLFNIYFLNENDPFKFVEKFGLSSKTYIIGDKNGDGIAETKERV